MVTPNNMGSFQYNALLLIPGAGYDVGPTGWSYERKDGYDLRWVEGPYGDQRWHVSFKVDGVDVLLDIDARNVIGVSIGPAEVLDGDSSRVTSGEGQTRQAPRGYQSPNGWFDSAATEGCGEPCPA